MCIEIINNNANIIMEMNNTKDAKKVSYSIKKVLKKLFKKHSLKSEKQQIICENVQNTEKANSLESLESLENNRNADIESEAASIESFENEANERISLTRSSCEIEEYNMADLPTVPVHFVRTEHGTFFWTAASDIAADNDLIEPLFCSTDNQIAVHQMQDRWAQA